MSIAETGLDPARGEIWILAPKLLPGHELPGRRRRLVLIVSDDRLNRSPAGLVIALPLTITDRRIPVHVRINPPEAGLERPALIMTDQIRTVTKTSLTARLGAISSLTLERVEDFLRLTLAL
jgi:mRNA interferase MazF